MFSDYSPDTAHTALLVCSDTCKIATVLSGLACTSDVACMLFTLHFVGDFSGES